MNYKLLLTLFSVFFCIHTSKSQVNRTVTVSNGNLETLLGTSNTLVTDLTLTGTINNADFETIKQMTALRNLDLGKVKVINSEIPAYAFRYKVLNKIILPSSLEVIGTSAFREFTLATPLVLPSGLKILRYESFCNASIPSLDFTQCSELNYIAGNAFWDLKTASSNILNFSKSNKLQNFETGAFQRFSGHVILPKKLTSIPSRTFQNFLGSVDLPEGLLRIEYQGFLWANLSKELVFPNSLEVIDDFAFAGAVANKGIKFSTGLKRIGRRTFEAVKTPFMNFSTSKNLEEIGAGAFMNVNLTENKTLDFFTSSKLSRFILYGGDSNKYGAFTSFNGNVILSNALTEIPKFAFYKFGGTITLPDNLKYIREEAFTAASITEITLPKNLYYIHHWAFLNCNQLKKITIKNPQPPFLESNVFDGVNKKSCKLDMPQGSLELYANTEQWKDFLDYVPLTPNKKNNIKLFYTDNGGKGFQATYEGVQIGEYYWMNNNLNHYTDPNAFSFANAVLPVQTKKDIDLGHERMAMFEFFKPPVTAPNRNDPTFWSYLLRNLKEAGRPSTQEEALSEFNKYYGNYYWNPFVRGNFSKVFQMAEGSKQNLKAKGVWDLPSTSDIRQLIGMCGYGTQPELVHYLSFSYDPQNKNIPAFVNIWAPEDVDNRGVKQGGYYWWFKANSSYYTNYNNPYQGPPAYGFNSTDYYAASNGNKFGFNLVPSGYRWDKWNQNTPINIWRYGKENLKLYTFTPANGDFSALNQEAWITLKDNADFHLYDAVEIRYPDAGIRRQPVRYCRPLTDAELGYKLYINKKLVSKTINMYDADLVFSGEEILLRDIFVNKSVQKEEISIMKLGLKETPPNGYYELEKGYIRGLYVQYILTNLNPRQTISDIIDIAWKNKNVWLGNVTNYTPPVQSNRSSIVETFYIEESNVIVYPNPVEDILYITQPVDYIEIFGINGNSILKSTQRLSSLSVNILPPGMYIVKMKINGKIITKKVIKE